MVLLTELLPTIDLAVLHPMLREFLQELAAYPGPVKVRTELGDSVPEGFLQRWTPARLGPDHLFPLEIRPYTLRILVFDISDKADTVEFCLRPTKTDFYREFLEPNRIDYKPGELGFDTDLKLQSRRKKTNLTLRSLVQRLRP
jgi:hypothetical protein